MGLLVYSLQFLKFIREIFKTLTLLLQQQPQTEISYFRTDSTELSKYFQVIKRNAVFELSECVNGFLNVAVYENYVSFPFPLFLKVNS